MARVTVEDCILQVTNRFDLVLVAAQRAREISSGSQLTIERDNDKNPVVALREIADKMIEPSIMMESLIKDHQKHVEVDEPVEEEMDLLAIQQELLKNGGEIQALPDVKGDEDLSGGDGDADEETDGAGDDSGRSTDEDHGAIG